VKDLATRTAQATEEIAAQIGAIQETSRTSVAAIRSIAEAVGAASVRTQDMSAVLNQQDGALRTVAESAEVSRAQTSAMLEGAGEIGRWVEEANRSASSVGEVSADVDRASQDIDHAVKVFLKRVAA
jgi:methyl-accepting chemotaxis protein